MDGVILGWVGISLVVLGNVSAMAFWGGKTSSKLSRVEELLNGHLQQHILERREDLEDAREDARVRRAEKGVE